MKTPYILLLITTLFVAGLLFLLVFILKAQKTPTPPTQEQKKETPAAITSFSPKNDPTIQFLPIQQISVSFNRPVDPSSVKITTSPMTEIRTRQGSNAATLIISARPAWKEGVTTITISSIGELPLAPPFIYQLKTGFPPAAPPDAKGI